MFNEVYEQLNNSKLNFSEKVNDSFGNAIVNDIYDPIERNVYKLDFAWKEAEVSNLEIRAILMELRTIL